MTIPQFLLPAFLLTCVCAAQVPLACNLKAFTHDERLEWRKLIDEVRAAAAVPPQELTYGYAFKINPSQVSITKVAQWIDLERKCCPFLDFQVDLHGANGSLSLALTGGKGVKEFIAEDFRPWFQAK